MMECLDVDLDGTEIFLRIMGMNMRVFHASPVLEMLTSEVEMLDWVGFHSIVR